MYSLSFSFELSTIYQRYKIVPRDDAVVTRTNDGIRSTLLYRLPFPRSARSMYICILQTAIDWLIHLTTAWDLKYCFCAFRHKQVYVLKIWRDVNSETKMASHSHTHKTRRTISIEAPSEFRMIFDSAGYVPKWCYPCHKIWKISTSKRPIFKPMQFDYQTLQFRWLYSVWGWYERWRIA